MRVRRLLTHGPDDEPVWRTIHVRPIDERWVAMILDDNAQAPGPDELNRQGTTIVQVTHSETNAAYGHRIIQLRDGWVANGKSEPLAVAS